MYGYYGDKLLASRCPAHASLPTLAHCIWIDHNMYVQEKKEENKHIVINQFNAFSFVPIRLNPN